MPYKNKYQKEKQQYSVDGGLNWIDVSPANYRRGRLLENASDDCNTVEWREVNGAWFCITASDLTRWIDSGVTECYGNDKYSIEKEQYSVDGGTTWTDTGQTRQGPLIQSDSPDCITPSVQYRWITVENTYTCVGTDKYTLEKEQSSTDGSNWADTGNTRAGTLIENGSIDCGSENIQYQWVTVDNEYICNGFDKYTKQKEQYSVDGQTWRDTGQTRQGTIIQVDSSDCGYVPSGTCIITSVKNGEFTLTVPYTSYVATTDSIIVKAKGEVTRTTYEGGYWVYAVLRPRNSNLTVNYIGEKNPSELSSTEYSVRLLTSALQNNIIYVGFEISGLSNLSQGDTLTIRWHCYDGMTDYPHFGHNCETYTTITVGNIQ